MNDSSVQNGQNGQVPRPPIQIDLELIAQKRAQLETIKTELKAEFVGIDYIIDELIDYIRIWYLMPEVLSRPIIVNLWGMTGVGKTDLVRKLVNKLHYQDRFVEVELHNGESDSYSWKNSVGGILEVNNITDGQPAIVLFDEIQRFSTLDPDGNLLTNTKYQDFWELLSDGKLARRDVKEDIDQYIEDFVFSSKQRKRSAEELAKNPPEVPVQSYVSDTSIGLWRARQLKKLFNLKESVASLAEMEEEEALSIMQERRVKKKIFEAVDHSKTLLIISGNLDEAFTMANSTAEADVDADIFNAYTQKISLVDIRTALTKKFKPEQVARFGNIHLIYRALRRADFEQIIHMEIAKIIKKNMLHFGIQLHIKPNINRLIYQNGVFPVQGVRPVFSSVTDVLEANLAKILFEALMNRRNEITVDYNFKVKRIEATFTDGSAKMLIPFVGRIDRVREDNLADAVANVSVHEAGHAVAYGVLFGLAPLQLKSKVASNYVGGFTFPHQIHNTKGSMTDRIKILLAGGLAEELVFGERNATTGRQHDRYEATSLAVDYIRKYGFEEQFQTFYVEDQRLDINTEVTNAHIELLMQKLVAETRMLLAQHEPFLLDLSRRLQQEGNIKAKEVAQIALTHGLTLEIRPEEHQHIAGYDKLLNP